MEKSEKAVGTVIGFGEVLWDTYPTHRKLGGAPFNVLGHLQQLSFQVDMISRIGMDEDGTEILRRIREAGVGHNHIQHDSIHPTGKVNVLLDLDGKPSYEIVDPSAWDFIAVHENSIKAVQKADVFICGTLAARNEVSHNSLRHYLAAGRYNVVDLNLRLSFYSTALIEELLQSANFLKINDDEFFTLAQMFSVAPGHLYSFLHDHFDIEVIVQTRGSNGAEASHQGNLEEHQGYSIQVIDTVGSGDAFLAGFLSRFLAGDALKASLDFGCQLGAYVATQPGAIPIHGGNPTI